MKTLWLITSKDSAMSDFGHKKLKKNRVRYDTWALEPGMSTAEYMRLRKKWDRKLSATGFRDIEFVSSTGQISPFFQGYSSLGLSNRFSQDTLDYFVLARTFLHKADWVSIAPKRLDRLYYFIWDLYSDGVDYASITKKVKSRAARRPRPVSYGTSIWYIHTVVKEIERVFLLALKDNPELFE